MRVDPAATSLKMIFFLQGTLVDPSGDTVNPHVGWTGGVEADFTVKVVAKTTGVDTISAADYVITEAGLGYYELLFTTLSGFTTTEQCVVSLSYNNGTDTIDQVFEEVIEFELLPVAITGATTDRSLGIVRRNTAQGGDANSIQLDASASATSRIYDGLEVWIASDTGAGQSRHILFYDGASKTAYVDKPWAVSPDNASQFILRSATSDSARAGFVWAGQAQAGGSATITLDTGASSTNSMYVGQKITKISASTFRPETRIITGYVGATRVATVSPQWTAAPDSTTIFAIRDSGYSDVAAVQSGAVTTIQSGLATAAALTTVDDFIDTEVAAILAAVDTEVAAIKAKTDNLPSDPADASDIAALFATVNTKLDTIDDFLDTEVAAIKAKTDNLPTDPADASDIAARFTTLDSTLGTIAGYLDTEIAAIKAKTDNLPSDPADASVIAGRFDTVDATLAALDFSAVSTQLDVIETKIDVINTAIGTMPADVLAAFRDWEHDDGVTWQGLMVRMDAWLAGRRVVTGAGASQHVVYERRDGSTAFEGDLDGTTGGRGESDVTGSEV